MEISLLGALVGGLLTLLSPCSVMLLPAFFSYAFTSPTQLLHRTGVFYLGLITTLVPLGVLAGTLGSFVSQHRFTFVHVAAIVVIVLGALMVLNVPMPFFGAATSRSAESTSPISVYMLGTVYGLAGVCAGPMLGAVLTVAAVSGNALYGGTVLLFFAAGMALPLLVLAALWGRLPAIQKLVRPKEVRIGRWRNTWTGLIGGSLTMGLGALLLATNGTASLSGLVGASDQMALESWARRATADVPDLLVVAVVVALVAGSITAVTISRTRRRTE